MGQARTMHTHTHKPHTQNSHKVNKTRKSGVTYLPTSRARFFPKKKEKKTLVAPAELPGIVNVINERLRHLAKIFTTLTCQLAAISRQVSLPLPLDLLVPRCRFLFATRTNPLMAALRVNLCCLPLYLSLSPCSIKSNSNPPNNNEPFLVQLLKPVQHQLGLGQQKKQAH